MINLKKDNKLVNKLLNKANTNLKKEMTADILKDFADKWTLFQVNSSIALLNWITSNGWEYLYEYEAFYNINDLDNENPKTIKELCIDFHKSDFYENFVHNNDFKSNI